MTKANGADQEEEDLDNCCWVFHKDIEIALLHHYMKAGEAAQWIP